MRLEPNYTDYTREELEEALSSIDRAAFPERTLKVKNEIAKRINENQTTCKLVTPPYRWTSTGRNIFFLLFFCILTVLGFSGYLSGKSEGLILLVIGFILSTIYAINVFRKNDWVQIDESGVMYQNILGYKCLCWDEIAACRIRYLKYTKSAILICVAGGEHPLPVTGRNAKEVNEVVNAKLRGKKA